MITHKVKAPEAPSGDDVMDGIVEFMLNNPKPIAVTICVVLVVAIAKGLGGTVADLFSKGGVVVGLVVLGLIIAGYIMLSS